MFHYSRWIAEQFNDNYVYVFYPFLSVCNMQHIVYLYWYSFCVFGAFQYSVFQSMHLHQQLIGFLHYSGLECSDWILLDTLVSWEPHTSLGVMWFCQFWGIYKLKRVFISVLKYQKNMSSKDVKELFLFLVLYFLMHFLKLF